MTVGRFRVLFHVLATMLALGLALTTVSPARAAADPTPVGYATITGHLKNPDGTPYTGGGSIAIYHFIQVPSRGQTSPSWQDIGGYTTNAPGNDGSFAVTDVALFSTTESLRIGLGSTGGYDAQYYNGSFTLDGASAVSASAGKITSGVDFTLAKNPTYGTISGKITDASSGNPVSAPVKIYPDDPSVTPLVVTSDAATGTWSARVPGSATYTVSFSENLSDGWSTRWYLDTDAASATHVSVPAGGTASDIDAHLVADANAAKIGGTLTRADGTPATGVDVRIYDQTHSDESFGTTTLPDGTWTATVQGGDTYKLGFSVSTDDLFIAEYWNNASTLAAAETFTPTAGSTVGTYDAALASVPVVNLSRPTISGLPRVGRALTATAGAWAPADATPHYQWLAEGRPIAGATSRRLVLGRAQAGHRVSVRVTAVRPGYASASATAASTALVRAVPRLRLRAWAKAHRRTGIRVVATAAVPVTGRVEIFSGRWLLFSGRLVDGRRTITVRMKHGRHLLRAHYLGSTRVRAASVRLRFKR